MSQELSKKERVKEQFKRFVPSGFEGMLCDLLFACPVNFKIVNPRATKLGDFRAALYPGEKHQITVNGDLNPYAFLITSLHEFAHLNTFEKFGRKVKPHGEEWKHEYRMLLLPAIRSGLLPSDLVKVLDNSLVNTKASSCSDIHLTRELKKYDVGKKEVVLLESLHKNATFALQGKEFVKGELRRKRYLCTERKSNRQFLVHALAEVQPINKNKDEQ
jgi:hypothetical protein